MGRLKVNISAGFQKSYSSLFAKMLSAEITISHIVSEGDYDLDSETFVDIEYDGSEGYDNVYIFMVHPEDYNPVMHIRTSSAHSDSIYLWYGGIALFEVSDINYPPQVRVEDALYPARYRLLIIKKA